MSGPVVWGQISNSCSSVSGKSGSWHPEGLQEAMGFRSLFSREACVMLRSINYLCLASTDDVRSLLELCSHSARAFQPIQPWTFRSQLLSPVHSHPRHLNSPGEGSCPHTSCPASSWCGCFPCPHAALPASARTVPLLATAPRLWHSAKGFSFLHAFLSWEGPHFPLSWHLCRKRSVHTSLEIGPQFLNGFLSTSIYAPWLT